jgi:hypothetical protein
VRQRHTLEAWEAQKARWRRLRSALTAQTGQPAAALVMERGHDEAADLDALSEPLETACGPAAWACSLRDNWTQLIPLGHPLVSGLAGQVSHAAKAQRLALVRREALPGSDGAGGSRRGGAPPRATHGVSHMVVEGLGLERMLRKDCARGVTLCDVVRSLRLAGHDDVAARVEAAAQEAQNRQLAVQAEEAARRRRRSSLMAGATAAPAGAPGADTPAADAAGAPETASPQPGVQLSPLMLSCRGRLLPVPAGSAAAVMVSNTGACALYYAWQLADSTCQDASQGPSFMPLAHGGPRPGVLLPGETRSVWFRFLPQKVGIAREIWQLRTAPPLATPQAAAVLLEGVARTGSAAGMADDPAAPHRAAASLAEARRRALMQVADAFDARLRDAERLLQGPTATPRAARSSRVSAGMTSRAIAM